MNIAGMDCVKERGQVVTKLIGEVELDVNTFLVPCNKSVIVFTKDNHGKA
jgi:hypothetical protein